MILVVCAVAQELRHWKPRDHVEMLVTGIGPVEAAAATSRALATSAPSIVINAGIGGGFRGRAAVGDAFAIETDHLAELGLEDGSPLPPLPGGVRLVEKTDSAEDLVEACARVGARIGSAITVSTITTSDARAEGLAQRFEAEVEAMEGFAVLRSAAVAGIPALELRGVSNLVGARERAGWDFDAGARAVAMLLDRFLDTFVEK
ncbi:MAG TPA: futalosine hydrolase [Candidatus Baltobacteraceae bacterium]